METTIIHMHTTESDDTTSSMTNTPVTISKRTDNTLAKKYFMPVIIGIVVCLFAIIIILIVLHMKRLKTIRVCNQENENETVHQEPHKEQNSSRLSETAENAQEHDRLLEAQKHEERGQDKTEENQDSNDEERFNCANKTKQNISETHSAAVIDSNSTNHVRVESSPVFPSQDSDTLETDPDPLSNSNSNQDSNGVDPQRSLNLNNGRQSFQESNSNPVPAVDISSNPTSEACGTVPSSSVIQNQGNNDDTVPKQQYTAEKKDIKVEQYRQELPSLGQQEDLKPDDPDERVGWLRDTSSRTFSFL